MSEQNLIPADILSNVPAHLQGAIGKPGALTTALGGGIMVSDGFAKISIKGSRFRLQENGEEQVLPSSEIYVAVVGANPNLSKTWYEKEWTPDADPSAPDCYSLDGIRPAIDSEKPQSDSCADCPHNAWGSKIAPNGQKLKACPDHKRLAVIQAGLQASEPSHQNPTVYLLSVPAGSLKALTQYQRVLASKGIDASAVATKVEFDLSVSHPKLKFSFGGFLDEFTYSKASELIGTEPVKMLTGEASNVPAAAVEPATQVRRPSVQPAAQPAPEEPKPQAAPQPAPTAVPQGGGFGTPAQAAPAKPAPVPPQAEPEPKVAKGNGSAQAAEPETEALAAEIAAIVGGVDG